MGLFKDIIGEFGGEIGTAVGAYFGNPQAGAAIGGALEQGVQMQEQLDAARAAQYVPVARVAPRPPPRTFDPMLDPVGLWAEARDWFTWENILGSGVRTIGIPQESIEGFARWYYERAGRWPHTGAYIEHARAVQREGRTTVALANTRRAQQWQTASGMFSPAWGSTSSLLRGWTSTPLFRTSQFSRTPRRFSTIPGLPGVLMW